MELTLARDRYTTKSTTGQLSVDGKYECFILEDRIRPPGLKVKKETCIPAGRYRVILVWSPKHKREVPLLVDVPNYTGVEIHPGNYPIDTEGCLLPGRYRLDDIVRQSVVAYDGLFVKISEAIDRREEVWITITNTETDPMYQELTKAA